MALTTVYKPFSGVGKMYAKRYGVAERLREVGNASAASVSYEEESEEQQDYTKGGGGVYASIKRVSSATFAFTWHDFSTANLRDVLFGGASAAVAGTVADEVAVAYKNGLVKTAHPAPTAVVVKDSAGTTTYVADTDYEVRGGGIYIPEGGAITDAQDVKISYSYAAYDTIEALIASAPELEIFIEGINEASTNSVVNVDIWRVKLGVPQDVSLITESGFGELPVEAEMIADPTRTGAGISKYMRIRQH